MLKVIINMLQKYEIIIYITAKTLALVYLKQKRQKAFL